MAIKINDNTITGNIYCNDDKVLAVYLNEYELIWEALPKNTIIATIYRRFRNGVYQFRVALEAEYPVTSSITANVQYHTSGASTTATIYSNEKYGYTGWKEGYPDRALITGISRLSDDTYRYTYPSYGYIVNSEPVVNSLLTAEAIQYYYPPPVPVRQLLTLKVESQYYVENWTVEARLYLRTEPIPFIAITTLKNTWSNSLSITEETGTKCEWQRIDQPSSTETGYYYVEGPTTFRLIDNR